MFLLSRSLYQFKEHTATRPTLRSVYIQKGFLSPYRHSKYVCITNAAPKAEAPFMETVYTSIAGKRKARKEVKTESSLKFPVINSFCTGALYRINSIA
jgi:hypothetical protein